jgi:hypothetical protein
MKPTIDDKVRAFLAFVDGDDTQEPNDPRILSEEELDRELAAVGFDVAAENAKGQAQHDAAVQVIAAWEAERGKSRATVEDNVRGFLAFVDAEPREDAADNRGLLSEDEVDRQLAAAGFDVDVENAKADAEYQALVAAKALSNVVPITKKIAAVPAKVKPVAPTAEDSSNIIAFPPRRAPWVVLLVAAAAVAALIGTEGSSMVAWFKDEPNPNERVTHGVDPNEAAKGLRGAASKAIAASEWEKALDYLDRAREFDAEGDKAPEVQRNRQLAEKMLGHLDAASATETAPKD